MLRNTGVIAAVLALSLAVAAAGATAQDFPPFVVKDIRVEGLQRTEPGTVFSYLPVKVGETMSSEKARAALRALYATGFFQDVRLDVEGDVLVVFVRERPAIAQIDSMISRRLSCWRRRWVVSLVEVDIGAFLILPRVPSGTLLLLTAAVGRQEKEGSAVSPSPEQGGICSGEGVGG